MEVQRSFMWMEQEAELSKNVKVINMTLINRRVTTTEVVLTAVSLTTMKMRMIISTLKVVPCQGEGEEYHAEE
jgi:hypothetical protein